MDALVALMHLSSLLMYLPALAEGTAEPDLIASSLQVWNGSVVGKVCGTCDVLRRRTFRESVIVPY